jgi:hypothetical protein
VGKRKYGVIVNIQVKSSELIILIAASAMSLLANLPEDMLGDLVDKKMLLIALTGLIVVAMFRYLQMFLLLLITILAIGANLPSELASALGISKMALIVSLGALIAAALLRPARIPMSANPCWRQSQKGIRLPCTVCWS